MRQAPSAAEACHRASRRAIADRGEPFSSVLAGDPLEHREIPRTDVVPLVRGGDARPTVADEGLLTVRLTQQLSYFLRELSTIATEHLFVVLHDLAIERSVERECRRADRERLEERWIRPPDRMPMDVRGAVCPEVHQELL